MRVTKNRVAWFAIGCLGMALFMAVLWVMLNAASTTSAIRSTQQSNTQISKTNAQTLQIIKDCTLPQGECYQRGKKQTADAVSNINRVVILAAACASGLPDGLPVATRQTEIQQCVIQRLAATTGQPKR